MPDALLALDGVTLRSPEGHRVFEGLSWRLARGGRHHLKGVRGGGATALLRLCCGIAEPEGGTILLDGLPLASHLRHPFLERGALGYVPSDGGLAVNMTLQDNVALPLRFALHQSRTEAAGNARLWLERAGLLELAGLRPRVPADAQSWLASLARAAARQPELWLVDRPPGSLDEGQTQAALAILARAGEDASVTMVLVGPDWLSGLGTAMSIIESRVFTGGQP